MPAYGLVRTVEDLLSVAEAMERQSADRYRGLATRLRKQGDAVVATEFEALAELEDRHVGEVAARALSALGRPASAISVGRPMVFDEEEEVRGALGSVYQALAFAVRNEERAFAFYTYVAAAAGNLALRALAEDLARDELDHASRLRRLRRRAFHEEKPSKVEIPESVERLRELFHHWETRAASAHAALADRLERSGQPKEADIFRRLAKEEGAAVAIGAPVAEAPSLSSVAEGLRLIEETFDRLAVIGETARVEPVMAEAQRMAQTIVTRLALVGEALSGNGAGVHGS
jgi:rubrerythrin